MADVRPDGHDHPAEEAPLLTRRRLLIGAGCGTAAMLASGALVAGGVLPGRTRLRGLLGLDGDDGAIPDRRPGPEIEGSFDSDHRRAVTHWAVSYPPGSREGAALPVLVSLHGKGGTHRSSFDELGLDRFLAEAVEHGAAPLAIAAVDGGDTYWHERDDGSDSGAMVVQELLPILARRGLDVERFGLFGWSMGGYGALHLAAQERGPRPRLVATLSAALWPAAGDTAPGAFDGPDDFASADVFRARARLVDVPLRMDCGRDDPFADANRAFRDGLLREPEGGFQPGAHTVGYWRRMVPDHLAFAAEHLAG